MTNKVTDLKKLVEIKVEKEGAGEYLHVVFQDLGVRLLKHLTEFLFKNKLISVLIRRVWTNKNDWDYTRITTNSTRLGCERYLCDLR